MNDLMIKLLEVLNDIELLCESELININSVDIGNYNKEFYFKLCNKLELDINYFINR